jgi:hypothetical protein
MIEELSLVAPLYRREVLSVTSGDLPHLLRRQRSLIAEGSSDMRHINAGEKRYLFASRGSLPPQLGKRPSERLILFPLLRIPTGLNHFVKAPHKNWNDLRSWANSAKKRKLQFKRVFSPMKILVLERSLDSVPLSELCNELKIARVLSERRLKVLGAQVIEKRAILMRRSDQDIEIRI